SAGSGDGSDTASILASGRGFGSGSGLGGTAAVRSTGLGETVGAARRGDGNTPSPPGSSTMIFRYDGAEALPSLSGCIGPPRGCGRVALLERGGGRSTEPGESDR